MTTCEGGKPAGLTANSSSSVSLDPPLVPWSLNERAASRPAFVRAGWFAVKVLGSHQRRLSGHFAIPAAEKFAGVDFIAGLGVYPVLADSLACFECSVFNRVPAGDHLIFLGGWNA